MGLDTAEAPEPAPEVIDMTEVMAAVAVLNNSEPPSGRVTEPASILQVTEQRKRDAEAREKAENPEIGEQMADGTFYLGRFTSEDGVEKDWFAAAKDAADGSGNKLLLDFNKAAQYAKKSQAHDHDDWMVPGVGGDGEPDILGTMFNLREKIGGFDQTGKWSSGLYWSSLASHDGDFRRAKYFSDGHNVDIPGLQAALSVRLVRSIHSPAQRKKEEAEEEARIKAGIPKTGERMPDGTIYAGISPTTHRLMFAAPSGILTKDFNAAAEYADNLQVGDKHDFLIPDKEELQVLFDNRHAGKLENTFNVNGTGGLSWYRSSSPIDISYGEWSHANEAWSQRFSDGIKSAYRKETPSTLRCIRYGKLVS